MPGLILQVIHHIFMKSNFINIYFSNSLLKWLGLTLWITKPIKLISREYFISSLRDYEFHLENICSINTKCGCPTYWSFDRYFRSHSWYIKATYTSWSGPLFSQALGSGPWICLWKRERLALVMLKVWRRRRKGWHLKE